MKQPRHVALPLLCLLVLALVLPDWQVTAAQDLTPPATTPVAAGSTTYVDPGGRFTVPVPTDWTAKTVGDVGGDSNRMILLGDLGHQNARMSDDVPVRV